MFNYALSLILRRKFRTFLTSLGITISVILLSLIIFGMIGLRTVITGEFSQRFRPNQLIISSQDFTNFGFGDPLPEVEDEEGPVFITPEIVEKIEKEDSVEKVDKMINVLNFEISLDKSKLKALSPSFIVGIETVKDVNYILEYKGDKSEPSTGEAYVGNVITSYYDLTPEEIIGRTITLKPASNTLFTQRSAGIVGKEYKFKIIGYVDAGLDRMDAVISLDDAAKIAAETGSFKNGKEYLDEFGYDQLFVDVQEDRVEEFKQKIKDEYRLNPLTSADAMSFLDQITAILTLSLSLFGVVAAVVASIGIVNTMVMSIYELTKEIGINKAIGASDLQILGVFLIQSGLIGFIGGFIGLAVVFGTIQVLDPIIVEELMKQNLEVSSFFVFDLGASLVIIFLSILVGVLAGIYPAIKAARLNPVKALRYE